MAAQSLKLVCMVAVLCMLVLSPMARPDITCDQVKSELLPCIKYFGSLGNEKYKGECCGGVKKLNEIARKNPFDRQDACECIKSQLGSGLQKLDKSRRDKMESLAKALPKICNVDVPYEISATTNCNNVK